MAYTERYVSSLAAGGGDGSVGSPWTFDEAVNAVTNGQRVNVKDDGIYTILGGAASYAWVDAARCGTPALPVMWRGYTTTIGDGGKARLRNGGSVKYLTLTGDIDSKYNLVVRDFDIEFAGATHAVGVVRAENCGVFINCRIAQTTASGASLLYCVSGQRGAFFGCLFENAHTGSVASACCATRGHLYVGCIFSCAASLFNALGSTYANAFLRNVCCCYTAGNDAKISVIPTEAGGDSDVPPMFAHNVFDGFNGGLVLKGDNSPSGFWFNNIFSNATNGIVLTNDLATNTDHALLFLGNKYYNVTNPFSAYLDELDVLMAPWLGMEELSNDPFVDRANGDYRVTQASGLIDTALPMYDYAGTPFGADIGAFDVVPVEDYPVAANVRHGVSYKSGILTGTCHVPGPADVRHGVAVDNTTGACHVPPAADTRLSVPVEGTVGSCAVPVAADVRHGVDVDDTTGTCHVPAAADVRLDVDVDDTVGTCAVPDSEDVKRDVPVDATVGTFDARRDIIFKDESSVG